MCMEVCLNVKSAFCCFFVMIDWFDRFERSWEEAQLSYMVFSFSTTTSWTSRSGGTTRNNFVVSVRLKSTESDIIYAHCILKSLNYLYAVLNHFQHGHRTVSTPRPITPVSTHDTLQYFFPGMASPFFLRMAASSSMSSLSIWAPRDGLLPCKVACRASQSACILLSI